MSKKDIISISLVLALLINFAMPFLCNEVLAKESVDYGLYYSREMGKLLKVSFKDKELGLKKYEEVLPEDGIDYVISDDQSTITFHNLQLDTNYNVGLWIEDPETTVVFEGENSIAVANSDEKGSIGVLGNGAVLKGNNQEDSLRISVSDTFNEQSGELIGIKSYLSGEVKDLNLNITIRDIFNKGIGIASNGSFTIEDSNVNLELASNDKVEKVEKVYGISGNNLDILSSVVDINTLVEASNSYCGIFVRNDICIGDDAKVIINLNGPGEGIHVYNRLDIGEASEIKSSTVKGKALYLNDIEALDLDWLIEFKNKEGNLTEKKPINMESSYMKIQGVEPIDKDYYYLSIVGDNGNKAQKLYKAWDEVTVKFSQSNREFIKWESNDIEIDENDEKITFKMPERNVLLKAISRPKVLDNYTEFQVKLADIGDENNESFNGKPGYIYTIRSGEKEGYEFVQWIADEEVNFFDPSAKTTTFEMVPEEVVINGVWRKVDNTVDHSNSFLDVHKTDWFYREVLDVYNKGLMIGTTKTSFNPYGHTNRGMIATILFRFDGEPKGYNFNPFLDVLEEMYYHKAINWAYENKIIEGYNKLNFGPEDLVTREQLVTLLYRYGIFKEYELSTEEDLSTFKDYHQISDYALDAFKWAIKENIIQGDGVNINPKDYATRAEVAAIINRFQLSITGN